MSVLSSMAFHFFLPAPTVRLTVEHMHCFERILEAARHAKGLADYDCSYSKFEFLYYLTQRKHYVLHGSPRANITRFEPSRPTAALDPAVAVYATDHEMSALFAAVRPDPHLTLSGYFWAMDDHGVPNTFYDFAFHPGGPARTAWTSGVVYVFPRMAFEPWGSVWASRGAVAPVLALPVTSQDLPLFTEVQHFEAQLSGGTSAAGGFVAALNPGRAATSHQAV